MFLDKYINQNITVKLKDEAKDNKTIKMFFVPEDHIFNKLMGVDEIGIWIEGFGSMTRYADKNGNPIPIEEQKREEVSVSVLIPWEYIDGIFIINDPESRECKRIGFN